MNDIARYAFRALDRVLGNQMNANGEYPGIGPEWTCEMYGHAGHNYYTCPDCMGNYRKRNEAALAAAGVA